MMFAEKLPRLARLVTSDGRVVCERCVVADRPWTRIRGLLGRASLPPGEGLLIVPCPSVHMWGMKFALDVVFLTREGRVADWVAHLAPGRYYVAKKDAGTPHAALELPAGTVTKLGLGRGALLLLEPLSPTQTDADEAAPL